MASSGLDVAVVPSATPGAVEGIWRELEQRADNSFFVSWYWIGAWLRAVRPAASFVVVKRDGVAIACALIARAPRSLRNPLRAEYRLHETGDTLTDGLFVEYNGILAARGEVAGALA